MGLSACDGIQVLLFEKKCFVTALIHEMQVREKEQKERKKEEKKLKKERKKKERLIPAKKQQKKK